MPRRLLIALAIFVLSAPGALEAKTLRVSSKDGARALAAAMAAAAPGDTILLTGGTYTGSNFRFATSGRPGAPIVLAAAKGTHPVLDGAGRKGDGILIRPGQGHYVIQGIAVRNMGNSGLATMDDTDSTYPGITIRDCEFSGNGWSGLELAAVTDFLVENVTASDNHFHGLNILGSKSGKISAAKGVVMNSVFSRQTGPEGHGLGLNQANNVRVEGCKANHNRIHGFDVSDWPKGTPFSHHITLVGNKSWDNGKAGFAVNSDSHDIKLLRNIAWKNGADWTGAPGAPGFWIYEGADEVSFVNNTSVATRGAGFGIDGSPSEYGGSTRGRVTYVNNLAQDNGDPRWEERLGLDVVDPGWRLTLMANNWGAAPNPAWPVVSIDSGRFAGKYTSSRVKRLGNGNMAQDPEFRNQAKGDLRPRPGSPVVDAGSRKAEVKFCGKAPDIGAVELCR